MMSDTDAGATRPDDLERAARHIETQFDLAAAVAFLGGFDPVANTAADDGRVLRLPMVVEELWLPAVGEVRTTTDGAVHIRTYGPGAGTVAEQQARRVLSIDVDPAPFDAVCAADPVLAEARQRHPTLRPVLFPSVYESLAWALLSQRTRMSAASVAMSRITQAIGTVVDVGGEAVNVFPEPERLAALKPMTGVSERKAARLRELAVATVDDGLTAARLRDEPEAIDRLQHLAGIGPFSAELALIRGAGTLDQLPRNERRFAGIVRDRYKVSNDRQIAQIAQIADRWRPYRAWAAFLLRVDGPQPG